jgi:hypothetical protein
MSDTQARLAVYERRARFASEFDVPDGGRYINDWASRLDLVLAELERVTADRDRAVDVANEAYDYDNKLREALREIMQLMIRHDDYRAYKIARAALAGGARAAQENQ